RLGISVPPCAISLSGRLPWRWFSLRSSPISWAPCRASRSLHGHADQISILDLGERTLFVQAPRGNLFGQLLQEPLEFSVRDLDHVPGGGIGAGLHVCRIFLEGGDALLLQPVIVLGEVAVLL